MFDATTVTIALSLTALVVSVLCFLGVLFFLSWSDRAVETSAEAKAMASRTGARQDELESNRQRQHVRDLIDRTLPDLVRAATRELRTTRVPPENRTATMPAILNVSFDGTEFDSDALADLDRATRAALRAADVDTQAAAVRARRRAGLDWTDRDDEA